LNIMNGRIEGLAPLTGVVWVALLILGRVTIGLADFLPPADMVVDYLMGSFRRVMWGGWVGRLSAFFLIWFAGSLRSTLSQREGAPGKLSEVAFGGGAATSGPLAVGFTIMTTAGHRPEVDGGISTAEAVTLYDVWTVITGHVVPVSLAALVGAAGVVSLRRAVFPSWFGWTGVVIALGCLSPIGYLAQVLAMVWLLLVSVWLYARGG
jgi:hypothetical protein